MHAADAAAVNPNGIKTLLPNGLSKFFINGKPNSFNGPRSLPKNFRDCAFSNSRFFNYFILAGELFAKALWSFETFLSVSNNLCGKLISSLESLIIFDESFRVTSVTSNYILLHLHCCIELFFNITSNQNKITIFSRFLVKSPK